VGQVWNFLVYDWVLHQVLEGSQKYNRTPSAEQHDEAHFIRRATVSQLATD